MGHPVFILLLQVDFGNEKRDLIWWINERPIPTHVCVSGNPGAIATQPPACFGECTAIIDYVVVVE